MKDPNKKSIGTMNIVLVMLAIFLVSFTVAMIILYATTGAIPDTLCACVFTISGGECGAMAWIKNTKERYREREWKKEDENSNAAADFKKSKRIGFNIEH